MTKWLTIALVLNCLVIASCGRRDEWRRGPEEAALLKGFFPGFSLVRNPNPKQDSPYYHLVDSSGKHIVIVGDWWTKGDEDQRFRRSPSLAVFLESHPFQISTREQAIRFAQLIRVINHGPFAVGSYFVPEAQPVSNDWSVVFAYTGPERDILPDRHVIRMDHGSNVIDFLEERKTSCNSILPSNI